MANQEHLDVLKQGVDIWNQWRQKHPEIRPDLRVAFLQKANLRGTNLFGANLLGADFR